MTKLGRLVKAGKIKSMEEIYLHSLPIKEYEIVDFFLPKLKDEVMKVCLCHASNFFYLFIYVFSPVQLSRTFIPSYFPPFPSILSAVHDFSSRAFSLVSFFFT